MLDNLGLGMLSVISATHHVLLEMLHGYEVSHFKGAGIRLTIDGIC